MVIYPVSFDFKTNLADTNRCKMQIKPFRAYRYNTDTVNNTGSCIAPPYDVIDAAARETLYQQSPYNIVRIIKGKTAPTDSEANNQYSRAADFLNQWISDNILKQDETSAIYAYVQNFTIAEKTYQRSGFIALGKLAEFGAGVQPHEQTLTGPKADRLNLMTATAAQFGQIFMLYDDPKKIADNTIDKYTKSAKPEMDFTDDENVRHRLFVIDTENDIQPICDTMADKEALIADGHHRYETALNYYNQTKNPAAAYRMMTFVNIQNEGLVVLPTHRLVGNLENFQIAELITKLQTDFQISRFEFTDDNQKQTARADMFDAMKKAAAENKNAFGIYAADNAFYLAVLKSKNAMNSLAPEKSNAWKTLDVAVLHKLILENILGIGETQLAEQTNVKYIKDIGDAIDKSIAAVDTGQKQLVFFMNPTTNQQVKAVAAQNEKMPQKSTFYYPKIFTGLTINKL